MLKTDPANDEITIFGCIFGVLLVVIIVSVVLGLRFFFKALDARMNRRLADYLAARKSDDEHE